MAPGGSGLTPAETDRLEAIKQASDLAALRDLYRVESAHDAYFAAKRDWRTFHHKLEADDGPGDDFPGDIVDPDDRTVHVHGITHADTAEEREAVRAHTETVLEAGHVVYTEQGIRRMYLQDMPAVGEMDDIRWAMAECKRRDIESILSELSGSEFESLTEDVRSVATRFREATFSLIESGRSVYGDEFAAALGDIASEFLMSHEQLATGEAFEAFRRTEAAATDPSKLADLQAYYRRTFLPQPLEREWLCRHDPELEIMTHARNERMAAYLLAHVEPGATAHAYVGAAHQPGVRYYLERYRKGSFDVEDFEPA